MAKKKRILVALEELFFPFTAFLRKAGYIVVFTDEAGVLVREMLSGKTAVVVVLEDSPLRMPPRWRKRFGPHWRKQFGRRWRLVETLAVAQRARDLGSVTPVVFLQRGASYYCGLATLRRVGRIIFGYYPFCSAEEFGRWVESALALPS